MPSQAKKQQVKQLCEDIKGKSLIYMDYKGIRVQQCDVIRSALRAQGSRLLIFKNTLLKKALDSGHVKYLPEVFVGMTALVITEDDTFSGSSKVVYEAGKQEHVTIKGGYYQGESVDADYVKTLATIPDRDVLYSMLVGGLEGMIANLVGTLDALKAKKESDSTKDKETEQANEATPPKEEEATKPRS